MLCVAWSVHRTNAVDFAPAFYSYDCTVCWQVRPISKCVFMYNVLVYQKSARVIADHLAGFTLDMSGYTGHDSNVTANFSWTKKAAKSFYAA